MTAIFFDIFFSRYRWYRRLVGGQWDLVFVESVCGMSWVRTPDAHLPGTVFVKRETNVRK